MWCTRWYLPLVLLPLPIAPPYFLVLFLFSTTLHARPCFYCIILLTAMFIASCYWPPVPLSTPLTHPWSENITTYADAILSRLPELPQSMIPATIPIVDRCWCDFPTGGIFQPYNVTQWELTSVERIVESLARQMRLEQETDIPKGTITDDVASPVTEEVPSLKATPKITLALSNFLGSVWPFSSTSIAVAPSPQPLLKAIPDVEEPRPAPQTSTTAPIPQKRLSWLRKEYDFRPYGFDVVIDFSWSR